MSLSSGSLGFALAAAAAVAAAASCVPAEVNLPVAPELAHVAEIHKARCGNCHVPVEPGSRSRAELEAAFPRHRSRVHLTDTEWAQMVEYLATQKEG